MTSIFHLPRPKSSSQGSSSDKIQGKFGCNASETGISVFGTSSWDSKDASFRLSELCVRIRWRFSQLRVKAYHHQSRSHSNFNRWLEIGLPDNLGIDSVTVGLLQGVNIGESQPKFGRYTAAPSNSKYWNVIVSTLSTPSVTTTTQNDQLYASCNLHWASFSSLSNIVCIVH